jgi:small-conductance mechanosensitive channel
VNAIRQFLEFELLHIGEYSIRVYSLVSILFIFLITKFILWVIRKALYRKEKLNTQEKGNLYALYQIIKYVVWVISIAFMFETIGLKITVLLAGSAALLVGVGLGLQQTFNDMISGIILLSERSIKVGDILTIDDDIVKIEDIGFRTSKGQNRDEISIIIPNSLITTSKVINWSHQTKRTRFKIDVGVAYGSDVDLVMNILRECAEAHPEVRKNELIDVRFVNFGNSSLDFQLLFFSENIFRIEKVKSDIRKIINKKFVEHHIEIPFQQMDLHLKTNKTNLLKNT